MARKEEGKKKQVVGIQKRENKNVTRSYVQNLKKKKMEITSALPRRVAGASKKSCKFSRREKTRPDHDLRLPDPNADDGGAVEQLRAHSALVESIARSHARSRKNDDDMADVRPSVRPSVNPAHPDTRASSLVVAVVVS